MFFFSISVSTLCSNVSSQQNGNSLVLDGQRNPIPSINFWSIGSIIKNIFFGTPEPICYDDLGCFAVEKPYDHLDLPSPLNEVRN